MSWKSVTIKAYASLGQESWLNRKCRDSSWENSDRRGPQEVSSPKPCSMPDQKRLLMLIPSQALTSHLSGHPVQQSSQKEGFTFQLEIFLFWSIPYLLHSQNTPLWRLFSQPSPCRAFISSKPKPFLLQTEQFLLLLLFLAGVQLYGHLVTFTKLAPVCLVLRGSKR